MRKNPLILTTFLLAKQLWEKKNVSLISPANYLNSLFGNRIWIDIYSSCSYCINLRGSPPSTEIHTTLALLFYKSFPEQSNCNVKISAKIRKQNAGFEMLQVL